MKILIVISFILLAGCASINTTYQSSGTVSSTTENIESAIIKNHFNMRDHTNSQVAVVNSSSLRIGNIENVISGHLLKNGISNVTLNEFSKFNSNQKSKCIIVEWGVSGRNARGSSGGYSQEVTVIIRNALSKELIYKGIGEYIGQTEIDDLRGALLAALKNFKI